MPVVLVLDESPRGGLRERIRERRESRANEKARQDDPSVPPGGNTRAPSRRITGERVQLWIEQLRDRIRNELGNSGENSSLQTQVAPPPTTAQPVPGVPGFSANPLPVPTVPQDKPLTSPAPEFRQMNEEQSVGTPGPELVTPQVIPPVTRNTDMRASGPMNPLQASESGKASVSADANTQAPGNSVTAGQDTTGPSDSSQGQPSGKPSGLTGILSNVGKILGTGNPGSGQQATKDGVDQETVAASPTKDAQKTASETSSSSKPLTTTRKTLAEIRKQILLKQSQEAAKPAN